MGEVYIVGKMEGHYKIGRSYDAETRLLSFSPKLPVSLSIHHRITTRDEVWLEKVLHVAYRHRRAMGEWFKLDESELALLSTVHHADIEDDLPASIVEAFGKRSPAVVPQHQPPAAPPVSTPPNLRESPAIDQPTAVNPRHQLTTHGIPADVNRLLSSLPNPGVISFDLPEWMKGPGHFAVRVGNNYLMKSKIAKGDIAIMKYQDNAEAYEIVMLERDGQLRLDYYVPWMPCHELFGDKRPGSTVELVWPMPTPKDRRIVAVLVGIVRNETAIPASQLSPWAEENASVG